MIKRKDVVSSAIKSVEYDTNRNTLKIYMKDGSVPVYYGVPEKEYNSLIAAGSVGKYFNENIRDSYLFS